MKQIMMGSCGTTTSLVETYMHLVKDYETNGREMLQSKTSFNALKAIDALYILGYKDKGDPECEVVYNHKQTSSKEVLIQQNIEGDLQDSVQQQKTTFPKV